MFDIFSCNHRFLNDDLEEILVYTSDTLFKAHFLVGEIFKKVP